MKLSKIHYLKKRVYDLLQEVEDARERKNKTKAVAVLLQRDYECMKGIDRKLLAEILSRAESYDRYWRQILADHENLRGKDYKTKRKMVQRKQIELGYEPNYQQNVHLLNNL